MPTLMNPNKGDTCYHCKHLYLCMVTDKKTKEKKQLVKCKGFTEEGHLVPWCPTKKNPGMLMMKACHKFERSEEDGR